MTDTIVTADRLTDRLRDTAAQLRRMQEIAKFGGDATGVRVKDPSLLLADLDEAVEALALRTPSEGRHTGADIDRAAHALENGTDLSLRWEELCIVADLVLSTFTSPQPEGLGVEVKPLEWRYYPEAFPPAWDAQTPFGTYSIEEQNASDSPYFEGNFVPGYKIIAGRDSLPAVQEACQADFDARIRSALQPKE